MSQEMTVAACMVGAAVAVSISFASWWADRVGPPCPAWPPPRPESERHSGEGEVVAQVRTVVAWAYCCKPGD